jgi:hypothetical protein
MAGVGWVGVPSAGWLAIGTCSPMGAAVARGVCERCSPARQPRIREAVADNRSRMGERRVGPHGSSSGLVPAPRSESQVRESQLN